MLVTNTNLLPKLQDQKLPQLLGRDVVRHSTQTEQQFCDEQMTILLSLLKGMVRNTFSGDVITLAIYDAQDTCEQLGVDPENFRIAAQMFAEISAKSQSRSPICKMF